MKIRLIVKGNGLGLGDEIALFDWKGSTCMIGRKECEMNLPDAYASHRHALLYQGIRGELRVRDLESTNGTYVNGQRISDCTLSLGDELRIGKTCFSVFDYRADRSSGSLDVAIRHAQFHLEDNNTHTQTRHWEADRNSSRSSSSRSRRKASAA